MSVFSLFDLLGTTLVEAAEEGLLPGGKALGSQLGPIGTALGFDVAEIEADGVPGWVVAVAFAAGVAATAITLPVVTSAIGAGATAYGLGVLLTPAVTTAINVVAGLGISTITSKLVDLEYQGIASLMQNLANNAGAAYYSTSSSGAMPIPSNLANWTGASPSLFNLIDSNGNIVGSFALTMGANGTVIRTDYAGPNQTGAVIATETINANGSTNIIVNPGQTFNLPTAVASTPNDTLTLGKGGTIVLDARSPYQGQIKGFDTTDALIIINTSVLTDPVLTLAEPGTAFAPSGSNGDTWLDVYFISGPFGIDIGRTGAGLPGYTLDIQPLGGATEKVTLVPVQSPNQPQTQTLAAGSTTSLQFQQDDGNSYIFAGTSLNNAPKLEFLGTGGNGSTNVNTTGTLTVRGASGAPAFGTIQQDSNANVDDGDGFQVTNGTLTDTMAPGTLFTADGNSALMNNGTVAINASGQGTFDVRGTISLSPLGNNSLDLQSVDVEGNGVIIEQGEGDIVTVGSVSNVYSRSAGLTPHFEITSGTLDIENPSDFYGIIGPVSAASGAVSLGPFSEVDLFNAQNITNGTFDTSTGILSLASSAGSTVASIEFQGVSTGLRLSQEPARGGIGAHLAINGGGSGNGAGGNIPLTFHT